MNILSDKAKRECTSCQMCAAVCHQKAITIRLNEDGFYRPYVNTESCNDCGVCTTVCYKFDESIKLTSEDERKQKQLYAAWSLDNDVHANTTSGGIADVLAKELFDEGYRVVGVVYDTDKNIAKHQCVDSRDKLKLFRGSKYIQSYTIDGFREIVCNCRKEKYAVFGTPCQIYAIDRMATRRDVRDHFVLIDIYCHGCPSMLLWNKYKEKISNTTGIASWESVQFRSKKKGWGNYIFEIKADNGQTLYESNGQKDAFYELFFSDMILNDACYDCQSRSTLEYTDIRLGDFWGPKYLGLRKGVSAVAIATGWGGYYLAS